MSPKEVGGVCKMLLKVLLFVALQIRKLICGRRELQCWKLKCACM